MALLERGLGRIARMCETGDYDVRDMLQYGHNYGAEKSNRALAAFLSEQYGWSVPAENLMITNGSSLGLELVCSVLASCGDEILVEDPTYFLATGILRDHGLVVRPVATGAEGLCLASLEAAIVQHPRAKLLYTIPAHHNPTGTMLPAAHRERLAKLCDAHGITIISDDVYQLLSYDGSRAAPVMPYYSRNAVSLGTFSKILAPGLRLGWIHAAPDMIIKLCRRAFIVSGGGLYEAANHPHPREARVL
jgi:DNA-binding transcriptional MocR family regulator